MFDRKIILRLPTGVGCRLPRLPPETGQRNAAPQRHAFDLWVCLPNDKQLRDQRRVGCSPIAPITLPHCCTGGAVRVDVLVTRRLTGSVMRGPTRAINSSSK